MRAAVGGAEALIRAATIPGLPGISRTVSDWQERITHQTEPAIVAEHTLRYAMAAPLITSSAVWADLGCGNGVAAAAVLGERRPPHAILVDLDADAADRAAAELGLDSSLMLSADLTSPEALARIGDAMRQTSGDRVVTCFEVVEHLSTFVPFLEWAVALARDDTATFVMSVPNDAFWSIENPFHAARWSDGAFDELRRLLPETQTLLRQVSLTGSALVAWEDTPARHQVAVDVGGEGTQASHFIAAFGPRHHELERDAIVVATQQLEQRRWERQRESNLALAEARVEAQGAEMEEWRAYIHELERELGRPLSGVQQGPTQS
jgi:SAM-dependent methyltransferase